MSRVTTATLEAQPTGVEGFAVTDGASAWSYGAWVEVISAAAADLHVAGFVIDNITGSNLQFECEFGTGPDSSSVTAKHAWRSFIESSVGDTNNCIGLFPTPVPGIASGDKVWVRYRTGGSSGTINLGLLTYLSASLDTDHVAGSGETMFSVPTGANQASITPSATPWAWSDWAEVWAGTGTETCILGLICRAPISGVEKEYEIGFGAASAEVPKTCVRTATGASTNAGLATFNLPAAYPVPAGTRVALRLRKNGTSTTVHTVALLMLSGTAVLTAPPLTITASEAITVTDAAALALNNPLQITASEAITVTENATTELSNDIFLQVAEAIGVAEALSTLINPLAITVAETIGVAEALDAPFPLARLTFDRVFVREYVALSAGTLAVRVHETITVTEAPLYANANGVEGDLGTEPPAWPGTTGMVDYWIAGI